MNIWTAVIQLIGVWEGGKEKGKREGGLVCPGDYAGVVGGGSRELYDLITLYACIKIIKKEIKKFKKFSREINIYLHKYLNGQAHPHVSTCI